MVKDFFHAVDKRLLAGKDLEEHSMAANMLIHGPKFPDLSGVDIAIVGTGANADLFRKQFYRLSYRFSGIRIADLGNIRNDTKDKKNLAFGLTEVLLALQGMGICPVVIGEQEDLSAACIAAYPHRVDHAMVSPVVPVEDGEPLAISLGQNKLFHLSVIGAQSYLVTHAHIAALEPVFHDSLRLGDLRANPEDAEPLLRQADIFTFDLSALKVSEFSASAKALPNGLYNEEACLLCRYAGISNKVSACLLYGFTLSKDKLSDSMQVAQMVWYIAEGFDNRFNDHPQKDSPNFMVYKCHISRKQDIVFIKSLLTERWWMEIPLSTGKTAKGKKQGHVFIGCTPNDFEIAKGGDIPENGIRRQAGLCSSVHGKDKETGIQKNEGEAGRKVRAPGNACLYG